MGARAGKPPESSQRPAHDFARRVLGQAGRVDLAPYGRRAAASRRASQRSAGVLAVMEAPAALASLLDE